MNIPSENVGEAQSKAPGGWSVLGTLTTQARDKQVALQVNFPQAGEYTVQFQLDISNVPNVIYCEADIIWTVAGNAITRRVTVSAGTAISGNGESVLVIMRDASIIAVIPENFDYKVVATVAKGGRGVYTNPPILEEKALTAGVSAVRQIAGGGFENYTIPVNAGVKALKVELGSTAGAAVPNQAIQVVFLDQTGTVELSRFDPRDYEWWPIPAAARTLTIRNRTAAQLIDVLPVWGIDG